MNRMRDRIESTNHVVNDDVRLTRMPSRERIVSILSPELAPCLVISLVFGLALLLPPP